MQAENPNHIVTNTFRQQRRSQFLIDAALTEEAGSIGGRPTYKQRFHQNLEASFGTK